MRHTLSNALLALTFCMATTQATAQDKRVEMRFAHWLPANHALAKLSLEPWAKSLEEASNGSIKVAFYPAQQLGKAADHYDMARDGIADMTWVSPGYQAGRFPIFAATELPLLVSKASAGSQVIDAWYRKYATTEMSDVRFCLAHAHVGAFHSRKPVKDPTDIKGMKIRPSSGTIAQTMSVLGATNVQVSAVEARDALDKGVADALTYPWSSLVTFGIHKAVRYHTDIPIYAGTFVWVMNKGWYERLSAKQKSVLDSHCSNDWALKAGAPYADFEDEGRSGLEKDPGHTIIKLDSAQLVAWKKAVEPVTEKWLQDASKKGLDARTALEELRKQLAAKQALL